MSMSMMSEELGRACWSAHLAEADRDRLARRLAKSRRDERRAARAAERAARASRSAAVSALAVR